MCLVSADCISKIEFGSKERQGSCEGLAVNWFIYSVMLEDIKVPFLPPALNILDWSQDCELAVTSGEHVQILVPKISAADADATTSQWDTVRFKVTDHDLNQPYLRQTVAASIFSVGEELSTCHPITLVWSPPGLARHGRSILAVLTSDHVLTFWEPGADPRNARNWSKITVAGQETMPGSNAPVTPEQYVKLPKEDVAKLRKRVRNLAWSPVNYTEAESPWGSSLIAVANDYCEISVMRVISPHQHLPERDGTWRFEPVSLFRYGNPFEWTMRGIRGRHRNGHASALSWSPWFDNSDGADTAVLAYLAQEHLYLRHVYVRGPEDIDLQLLAGSPPMVDMGSEIFDLELPYPVSMAQLKWHNKIFQESLCLAVASSERILIMSMSIRDSSGDRKSRVVLDTPLTSREKSLYTIQRFELDSWDPISALIFSEDSLARRLTLCCATHLSSTRTFSSSTVEQTIDIQMGHPGTCPIFVADDKLHEPAFGYDNSLARYRSQFALENDLGERCIVRTWKATACPLGCWIAGSISLHPEDVLEYSTASVEKSIIAFSPTGKLQSCLRSGTHDRHLSPEALLFGLSSSDNATAKANEMLFSLNEELAKQDRGARLYAGLTNLPAALCATEQILTTTLRKALHSAHTHLLRKCYALLIFLASQAQGEMNGHTEMNDSHEERDCTFPSGAALVEKNLVEQAVRSILQLPRCFITTSQSKRLFYIDACLALQLGKNDSDLIELSENALSWLQETEQVDLGKELEYSKNIKASPSVSPAPEWPTKSRHEVANKKALEIFELCEFCGEIIGWTKSMDARCANGHVFGRCALTFLAIQAPGLTKKCRTCQKECLDDAFMKHWHTQSITGLAEADVDQHADDSHASQGGSDQDSTSPRSRQHDFLPEDDQPAGVGTWSLPQALIVACNVCLYCGGKYVS